MSAAQSTTRVKYEDLITERIHEALNFNRNHRFFLIYGANTSDEFLTKSMLRANLRETLWATLRASGFESVVFYNHKDKLFFLDESSYQNTKELRSAQSQVRSVARPASPRMQGGPLGARNVIKPPGQADSPRPLSTKERPPIMSDKAAMTNMDDLVKNTRFRSALVIEDTENFFSRFEHEIKDQLAMTLRDWSDLKTDNSNAVIFITPREPYDSDSVETMLRTMAEFPELTNLMKVATGKLRVASDGYILHVPAPDDRELNRLLNEIRLKNRRIVNWLEKSGLEKALAAEHHSLKKVVGLLNELEATQIINLETARLRKWISADSNPRPAIERLRELIGVQRVKRQIEEKAYALQAQARRFAQDPNSSAEPINLHMVLTGNPGTGKTTVAKLLGEIYRDLGLLRRGHTIDASRQKLVSEYVGGTAPKTNELIDSALDGVLFIDEAYDLKRNDRDEFGEEAINTLLARMENERHRLAVVVAGYEKEMSAFINSNPGLTRRFSRNNFLNLDDYSPEELFHIFELMTAKRGFTLSDEMKATTQRLLRGMYENRMGEGFRNPETGRSNYGNAGEVRNLVDEIATAQAYRLKGGHSPELSVEDIPSGYMYFANLARDRAQNLGDLMSELQSLVGLQSVKELVSAIVDDFHTSQLLPSHDSQPPTRHMLFTGNPGTGKTTVAELIGKMFWSLGILKSGHLVSISRGDLVAEYLGQTAQKTRKVIESALDGVLFIDEAYDLAHDERDSYGKEAVAELVLSLEKFRDRLIVIFAGYTKEMKVLVQSNSGIRSRIGYTIEFPDYNEDELLEIFLRSATRAGFTVPDDVRNELLLQFRTMYERRDRNFGNARDVRVMFFDKMVSKFNGRVVQAHRKGQDPSSIPRIFLLSDVPGVGAKPSNQARGGPGKFSRFDLAGFQQQKGPLAAGENVLTLLRETVGFVQTEDGSGTGFVVSPVGHILTAYHVVEGSRTIKFRLSSSDDFVEAEHLAEDRTADIAILKVDARGIPYAKLMEAGRTIEMGSPLGLFGYPLGQSLGSEVTYTAGHLSSLRKMPDGVRAFQIDLSAYKGSSGGPVFLSETGEVIGILSFGPNDTMNFAISIDEFYERFR